MRSVVKSAGLLLTICCNSACNEEGALGLAGPPIPEQMARSGRANDDSPEHASDAGDRPREVLDEIGEANGPVMPFQLAREAGRFTDHKACILHEGRASALLSDALGELSIDSLASDACRIVEAVHAKAAAPCDHVVLRSLQDSCKTAAAVAAATPSACPLVAAGDPSRGREPLCLALASHDAQACDALEGSDAQSCRAALLGSRAFCMDAPTRQRRESCVRVVERWRGLTVGADAGGATKTEFRVRLTTASGVQTYDALASGGAVLVEKKKGRMLTLAAMRGRQHLKLSMRTAKGFRWELESLELSDQGLVVARAGGQEVESSVVFDAGLHVVTISLRSRGDTGSFATLDVVAPVRDRVAASP